LLHLAAALKHCGRAFLLPRVVLATRSEAIRTSSVPGISQPVQRARSSSATVSAAPASMSEGRWRHSRVIARRRPHMIGDLDSGEPDAAGGRRHDDDSAIVSLTAWMTASIRQSGPASWRTKRFRWRSLAREAHWLGTGRGSTEVYVVRKWRARKDSNLRPSESKSDALSS
jgi:hypothetical protein